MAVEIEGEAQDVHVLLVAYHVIDQVAPIMGLLKDIGVEAIYKAIGAAHAEASDREKVMLDLFGDITELTESFDQAEAQMQALPEEVEG